MCPSRCDQPPTGQLLSSKWRSESIALRRATGYQPFDKLRAGVQGRKGYHVRFWNGGGAVARSTDRSEAAAPLDVTR